ncbi:hypothetical protein [Trinickia violacea]|nr:hypothetical protein [Trinickia violacea]
MDDYHQRGMGSAPMKNHTTRNTLCETRLKAFSFVDRAHFRSPIVWQMH